jgi:hypothetical protein
MTGWWPRHGRPGRLARVQEKYEKFLTAGPALFAQARQRLSVPVLQAENIGKDIFLVGASQNQVWHGGVRRLEPDMQRRRGHAGCPGHAAKAGRIAIGRANLIPAHGMALGTGGLREGRALARIALRLRPSAGGEPCQDQSGKNHRADIFHVLPLPWDFRPGISGYSEIASTRSR